MTTVSQIIRNAFRENNVVGVNEPVSGEEEAEALTLLNRLVKSVIGTDAGDKLTTIYVGRNNIDSTFYTITNILPEYKWFSPANSRIICNNTTSIDIHLNPYPNDGERFAIQDASGNFATYPVTVHGNGNLIDAASTSLFNQNNLKKEYFYRADLNEWMLVSELESSSIFPFPEEFEDLFVIHLAMRINPRNGIETSNQSVAALQRMKSLFKSRYRQTVEQASELALIKTPGMRHKIYGTFINPTQRFNTGYF